MKRSEMIDLIKGILEVSTDVDLDTQAENLLANLEQAGMRMCETRDLSGIGKLWTPEGWAPEDWQVVEDEELAREEAKQEHEHYRNEYRKKTKKGK